MTIIDQQRRERGISLIAEKARHIRTAAEFGLGTADPQQIDLVEARLG